MEDFQNVQNNPEKPKTKLKGVLYSLLVIVLIAGNVYLYLSWQNTKEELKSAQAQLVLKDKNINKLETELKDVRDIVRKKDVAQFATVIQAYNKSASTGHLTTEGTISKNIYDTQLSKSIKDFNDPTTGQVYGYVAIAPVQSPPPLKVGVIQYQWPAKCGAKTIEDNADQSRTAIATLLENGSMYCLNI